MASRVLALLLLTLGASCARRERATTYAKPAAIERVAREIEAAAATGPDELGAYFDWTGLAARAIPSGASFAERGELLRGLRRGLESEGGVAIVRDIAAADYSYRGVRWRDGRPTARFRLLTPEGGFNFHDLVLASAAPGEEPRVVDVHVLYMGEYLSDSLRRLTGTLLGGRSWVAWLTRGGRSGTSPDELRRLTEFTRAAREATPEEALAAYDRVPDRFRGERALQIARITAAAQLEDQERYFAILDEVARATPDDPSLSAIMLDAHCAREHWDACFADIAAIRAEYDDPYLDAFEARMEVLRGDPRRGLALAEQAVRAEDTLFDAHDAALFAALATGETERATEALRRLVADFGVDRAALAQLEGYEGIAALPDVGAP